MTAFDLLNEQLAARREAMAVAILDVADSEQRHVLSARLAALVEAEGAIAREYGRDGFIRGARAFHGIPRVRALAEYDRQAVGRSA